MGSLGGVFERNGRMFSCWGVLECRLSVRSRSFPLLLPARLLVVCSVSMTTTMVEIVQKEFRVLAELLSEF